MDFELRTQKQEVYNIPANLGLSPFHPKPKGTGTTIFSKRKKHLL